MPQYEYTCKQCKKELTVLCKLAERDQQECPECGAELTREEIPKDQGRMATNWGDWRWRTPTNTKD